MNNKLKNIAEYFEVIDPSAMPLRPVVSVLMITYNHGLYLAEAIESVAAQKADFPIELVIAEDCSTDNTRNIALDYQLRYPHLIRVIHSDNNVGMHENFLRALRACQGEFIALCEGDDYWVDRNKLQEQVNVLNRNNKIDITFHSCYRKFEKNQKRVLSHVRSLTDKIFTLSEVIAGGGDFMPTASILVRSTLVKVIHDWFDEIKPPVGDYFFQIFGSRNGGAYYINKPMSVYRKDVDVAWSKTIEEKIDSIVKYESQFFYALSKLAEEIPEQEDSLKRHITVHYSRRFLTANEENFEQIKKLVIPAVNFLYGQENSDKQSVGDEISVEYKKFLKLARNGGTLRDMADIPCGAARQFLRVAYSFFEYCWLYFAAKVKSKSSLIEYDLVSFKLEAQKSYLMARWIRFYSYIK